MLVNILSVESPVGPPNLLSFDDSSPSLGHLGSYFSLGGTLGADSTGMYVGPPAPVYSFCGFTTSFIYPVTSDALYSMIASFKSFTDPGDDICAVNIRWVNSTNTVNEDQVGSFVTDNATGWTQSFYTGTAPSWAAYVLVGVSNNTATQNHYIDYVGLFQGDWTTWSPGSINASAHNSLFYEGVALGAVTGGTEEVFYDSVANGEFICSTSGIEEVFYDSVANGEFIPLVEYPANGQLDLTFSNFAFANASIDNTVLYTSTAHGFYQVYQTDPFFGNVNPLVSAEFSTQLNFVNAAQPVVYTVTKSSPNLDVSTNGRITGAKTMPVGTYSIAGTALGANGGFGSWVFNLNVVDSVAPGSSVVPIIAPTATALPTGLEMLVPFQIDPATGAVASITNYAEILAQHIKTIVMTSVNQRLMLPNYGSRLVESTFAPIHGASLAMMAQDLKAVIETWEPAVNIINVNVSTNPSMAPSTVVVAIDFSVVPYNSVSTVVVTSGGNVIQVSGS